ncbi:GNAT family N-acetyltransferase [Roseisalinus antarcticus]|uniref:Putative N-acetyltransferase YsnE n=1 Tax=Roseisalinus antarcticus TaxID=254357 RepID=A0A1Y5SN22_9RHOB|nr:GNAT family N-acetyltransferase [Roseisalinus antarcticus]SLN44456.1 putative N-acetyltransferase YsnE [Roseisalinus antarcticus]
MIEVRPADPRDPGPRALLEASHALMQSLFPAEDNHYLSIEALTAPDIRFFTATAEGETLATGALALRDGYGEVKSMFTAETARGRGAARLILDRLEQEAVAQGLAELKLETGNTLSAAHRLYERMGFAPCAPFGSYTANTTSIFMRKPLA